MSGSLQQNVIDTTYGKENGKVRYVICSTITSVSCCVKNGSYSSPYLEWKLIAVLLEYLTISTNIRCYEACHWWQF